MSERAKTGPGNLPGEMPGGMHDKDAPIGSSDTRMIMLMLEIHG